MDGGVPIKAPVAGIAMGLVKDDDQIVVLSDILRIPFVLKLGRMYADNHQLVSILFLELL